MLDKIYICIFILIIVLILIKLNNKIFKTIFKKKNTIYLKFLKSIITVLLYVAGIVAIFMQFESTEKITNSMLTSSGIIVAVAVFAAQESLNDIIGGMMLSWSKPFEIGERVSIIGLNIIGTVEGITIRHTIIRTFNNSRIVIPNSVLNKQVIENNSNEDSRAGNFLDITISYESDIDKAIEIILNNVKSHELVLITDETPVSVSVRSLGENGVELRSQIWTRYVGENFRTCSDLRKSIYREFKENNIEISYKHIKLVN